MLGLIPTGAVKVDEIHKQASCISLDLSDCYHRKCYSTKSFKRGIVERNSSHVPSVFQLNNFQLAIFHLKNTTFLYTLLLAFQHIRNLETGG